MNVFVSILTCIGLVGMLACLKGLYDFAVGKVKAKEWNQVVTSAILFIGMVVVMALAIIAII